MTTAKKRTTAQRGRMCGECKGTGTIPSGPSKPLPPHAVIAARAGVHRSTVTRILSDNPEQWRLRTTLQKVRKVAKAMDMTVEQLMRHLGV